MASRMVTRGMSESWDDRWGVASRIFRGREVVQRPRDLRAHRELVLPS